MTPRAYALALSAATIAFSTPAQSQDECTKLIIYTINQFCRLLPNGLSMCQPVALAGPSPACEVPAGSQLQQVPLAPPTVQPPGTLGYPYTPQPFTPYTPFPAQSFPGYLPPQIAMPAPPAVPSATAKVPRTAAEPPKPVMAEPAVPTAAVSVPAAASVAGAAAPAPTPPVAMMPVAQPPTVSAPKPAGTPAPAKAPVQVPAQASAPATEPVPARATDQAPAQASAPSPSKAPDKAPTGVAEASPDSGVVDALAHFAFDSAELTEAGRGTLDAWLAHAPVGMPVVVSGYADRLGPEPYNLDLSLRRAMAARDYLVARGKDARDIRIHAKGENEPVKNCRGGPTPATKACLAPNRRVVIVPE